MVNDISLVLRPGKHIGQLLFFLVLLHISFSGFAQVPAYPDGVIKEDTLEMIENDSVITYIVEIEPYTVHDTVLVDRIRKKLPPVYFSLNASLSATRLFLKARSSFEDYVKKVNTANVSHYTYSFGAEASTCPKKTYFGIAVEFFTIKERFQTTRSDGEFVEFDNRYKYTRYKAVGGRWFNKGDKISYQLTGSVNPLILFSYSGFTLSKSDPSQITRLNREIGYRVFHMDYSIHFKVLLDQKSYMLEIGPYINISPHSATKKEEVYKVRSAYVGIKAGLITKFF